MSERTIRDVMLDDPATCINMGIVGEVLGLLGLDPNVVLDKDCETCTLDDGTRAAVPGDDCPDCNGSGWITINRVKVLPAWVTDDGFRGFLLDPTDQRALRIGRAVLACAAGTADERVYMPGGDWTSRPDVLLRRLLAAGDDK